MFLSSKDLPTDAASPRGHHNAGYQPIEADFSYLGAWSGDLESWAAIDLHPMPV